MLRCSVLLLLLMAATVSAVRADIVIYQDDFSGSSGTPLNGAAEDAQGALWSANNFVNADGSINGANEGGALLPFNPVVDRVYTLSMDVLMPVGVDRWVALGFARDPLVAPGTNNVNDRLSNEPEGLSWMLYRDHATPADEIQIFRGARTTTTIADTNPAVTFGITHNLKIVIDTAGNGSSYTANFFLDNVSLLAGGTPVTISAYGVPAGIGGSFSPVLDTINYVGFAFDNTTANPPRVDNFLLAVAVPEAGSLAFGGVAACASLAGWAWRKRRADVAKQA